MTPTSDRLHCLRPMIACVKASAALALLTVPDAAFALPSFRVLALTDGEAPGTGGGTFSAVFTPSVNAAGEAAFDPYRDSASRRAEARATRHLPVSSRRVRSMTPRCDPLNPD